MIGALIGVPVFSQNFAKDGIEIFESAYNRILIEKQSSTVAMRFRRRGAEYMESAIDLQKPLDLVVPYTRTLFVGAFFQPNPKHVLLIGLGGGGFNRLFNAAFPNATLHSAELDPKIVDLAKSEMGFRETAKNAVTISDGRIFLKRDTATYDWIILDAFRGGYVPSHLKTVEFYTLVKAHLSDGGILLTNLHNGTALFSSDVATLRASFPKVCFFCVRAAGNVIAVAAKSPALDFKSCIRGFESEIANAVLQEHLNFEQLKQEKCTVEPEANARVLTDDFAPAEYLEAISRANKIKE